MEQTAVPICQLSKAFSLAALDRGTELFRAYLDWAKENNEYTMTATRFGTEMAKRFDRRRTGTGMVYIGIGLKNDRKQFKVSFMSNSM